MSRLKNFSRNLAASYLQMGVNALYSLVSVPIILHWLSKAEFGIWALLVQFTTYMWLLDMGINQAIARLLIDHKDCRENGEYGSLIKASALVSAIQGMTILAAVFLGSSWLAEIMKIPAEYRATFVSLMRYQGLITTLVFCLNPFVIMLSAHQRMDIQAWQFIGGMMVSLTLLVFFLARGCGIYSFVYANGINVLLLPAYYLWICRRLGFIPRGGEWGKVSWQRFKGVFDYGKEIFKMNVGVQLASASQTIVVARALGLNAAATWAVGTKVYVLMRQLIYQPTSASVPALSEMVARGEMDKLRYRFKNLVGITASLAVFLGVVYVLCNSLFVEVWTSGKIHWTVLNDVLLALWLVINSLQTTNGSLVFANKQIGYLPYVFMAEGCAYILLSIGVGYRWGISGIIAASVVCLTLFSCHFSLRKSRSYFHITFSTLLLDWARPAFKLAALFIPLAVGIWFATSSLPMMPRLVANGVGAGLCGAALFLRLGLPSEIRREAALRLPRPVARLLERLGMTV